MAVSFVLFWISLHLSSRTDRASLLSILIIASLNCCIVPSHAYTNIRILLWQNSNIIANWQCTQPIFLSDTGPRKHYKSFHLSCSANYYRNRLMMVRETDLWWSEKPTSDGLRNWLMMVWETDLWWFEKLTSDGLRNWLLMVWETDLWWSEKLTSDGLRNWLMVVWETDFWWSEKLTYDGLRNRLMMVRETDLWWSEKLTYDGPRNWLMMVWETDLWWSEKPTYDGARNWLMVVRETDLWWSEKLTYDGPRNRLMMSEKLTYDVWETDLWCPRNWTIVVNYPHKKLVTAYSLVAMVQRSFSAPLGFWKEIDP